LNNLINILFSIGCLTSHDLHVMYVVSFLDGKKKKKTKPRLLKMTLSHKKNRLSTSVFKFVFFVLKHIFTEIKSTVICFVITNKLQKYI